MPSSRKTSYIDANHNRSALVYDSTSTNRNPLDKQTCQTSTHAQHFHRMSQTSEDDFTLLSFGEALIRYKPVESTTHNSDLWVYYQSLVYVGVAFTVISSLFRSVFLRSVGGDELNVCVAQATLGRKAQWVRCSFKYRCWCIIYYT